MKQVAISEFKAKCLELLEQVRRTRQPLRVTRHGKPVAEIVPAASIMSRDKWIGSMKGKIKVLGNIISPATDEEEWEALRD